MAAGPTVTVKTAINVRGGPGTNYPIIGSAQPGETLTVTGQAYDCGWLAITTPAGAAGWVSGSPDLVTLSAACSAIPAAAVPPTPTPAPASAPAPAPAPPGAAAAAPTEAPPPASVSDLPSDKGCYLFVSYIGDELTVTLTAKERPWNKTFKLPGMGQQLECLDPGRYSYTMNHPKWVGGGEITVEAGKHFRFPIIGRD